MALNQAYLFLIFTINGIIVGILFDIFRILRRSFKTSNIFTYIEDVLFWILTGLILLYSIFTFSNGEIRFYMFLGVFLGCILYMLLFSRIFVKVNVKIILSIKGFLKKVFTVIAYPFIKILKLLRPILFKPINFITINIKKIKNITFFSKNKKDFLKKSRKI